MAKTKIACVQMDIQIGRVELNRQKIVDGVRAASQQSAEIVIFPECALTGYCFDSLAEAIPFAEKTDGPSAEIIAGVSRETGAHVVAGFIEQDGSAYYNAAMLASPDGQIRTYRKVHMPFLGIDRFLTPGDRAFEPFALPQGKVGINICYDTSFPEAARVLKLRGAELVLLPTNWPSGAWRTADFVINTRAQENHVNFAAVDRVGVERGWRFIGKSIIVDYNGDTIARASDDKEEILFGEVDFAEANKNRTINVAGAYELDRLGDRRPEFYGPITEVGAASTRSRSAT